MSTRVVTGGNAAIVQVSDTLFEAPSLVAETCAVPAAAQVTNPAAVTVSGPAGATCQAADVVTSIGTAVPVVSFACNCSVCPRAVRPDTPEISNVEGGVGTEGGEPAEACGLVV